MRTLRLLVVGVLAAAGLATVGAAPSVAAERDLALTKTVTVPLQVLRKFKETPIPSGGTSYYCAVGSFIPFDDIAGWVPDRADYLYFGAATDMTIPDAPYSDGASINGLAFPPVGYQHHAQIGDFSYGQGGSPGDQCAEMEARVKSFFSETATVTYVRTEACAGALAKVATASDAVAKAKKKAANTTGAAHTAAVKALVEAKAKLKRAKAKAKKKCK